MKLPNEGIQISQEQAERIKFDTFNGLSLEEKIKSLSEICQSLKIEVNGGIKENNVNLIRDTLILFYKIQD